MVESLLVIYLCVLSVSGLSLIVARGNLIKGNYHVVPPQQLDQEA